jgi:hydrogenase maturation protease
MALVSAKILVVGFGNTLMGDDGVGPMVIRHLKQRKLPANLRVVECASDSLILPSFWRGEAQIWMIDALVRRQEPGTIHSLGHDEVMSIPQRHATVHHLSLPEGLRWIRLTYPEMRNVTYRLWGIEPDGLDLGERLSPNVEESVGRVSDMIIEAQKI